jgi:hypothetical protein
MAELNVMILGIETMQYEALPPSPLFGNTNITAAHILDVEAISLTLSKHSFNGYNTIYSRLLDLSCVYRAKLSYKNTSKNEVTF